MAEAGNDSYVKSNGLLFSRFCYNLQPALAPYDSALPHGVSPFTKPFLLKKVDMDTWWMEEKMNGVFFKHTCSAHVSRLVAHRHVPDFFSVCWIFTISRVAVSTFDRPAERPEIHVMLCESMFAHAGPHTSGYVPGGLGCHVHVVQVQSPFHYVLLPQPIPNVQSVPVIT